MRESDVLSDGSPTSILQIDADSPPSVPAKFRFPPNRSTSNLVGHATIATTATDRARIRFSFDATQSLPGDVTAMSPVMSEHEHGLGASGLRRIRQQPPSRLPGLTPDTPSVEINAKRSSSINLSYPSTRVPSGASAGPASPTINFGEDLSRFPSESLHSFSFAHQTEDSIHGRQNVLKRSIEFMRDRLGWAASNPGIINAQAKVAGDVEAQSMMELLSQAKVIGNNDLSGSGLGILEGPLTGPAQIDGGNIFEKNFAERSESPEGDENTTPTNNTSLEDEGGVAKAPGPIKDGESNGILDTSELADALPSESSSRTTTNESRSTTRTTPPATRRVSLKRTYTDISPLSLQTRLMEALATPYIAGEKSVVQPPVSPGVPSIGHMSITRPHPVNAAVHGHTSRWVPAAQAIFTTEAASPWTILAANDLACLVFGVTKSEVRKLGILEVVQEDRRQWLEDKLRAPGSESVLKSRVPYSQSQQTSPTATTAITSRHGTGVTAQLLSKPAWRDRRAKTDDGSGVNNSKKGPKAHSNHAQNKSRGVLLCGDVVPIQKRNGAIGSASLWVKEKRGGLIWVLEEIAEDVAYLTLDDRGRVRESIGAASAIWGEGKMVEKSAITSLMPQIPLKGELVDYDHLQDPRNLTVRTSDKANLPATVQRVAGKDELRVSAFPHIAGMMVLSASTLRITSSNSVFSAALFGQSKPDGLPVTDLIPGFDRYLKILTQENDVELVDGIVIPEHSFRRARAMLALKERTPEATAIFLNPVGLPARHQDGTEIKIDVQMRVVKSHSTAELEEDVIEERSEDEDDVASTAGTSVAISEVVYALWITYSRHLHATAGSKGSLSPLLSRPPTPPHQPSPGQTQRFEFHSQEADSDDVKIKGPQLSRLSEQILEAASQPISDPPREDNKGVPDPCDTEAKDGKIAKKSIGDFVILEEMGQGAYGQVKLARYRSGSKCGDAANGNIGKKMVLKYVTKRRILVDTWTRDRRLGTVPLEIHVLDYLRKDGLRHPNIVEMADFFEDDVNYYIEMVPHGLPGMDLFDYIELRVNMEEAECRSIFKQVADAIHHLHTKAMVVHRDIKDENVVLDGEGRIKLIDFGSAAYIKNAPFDVFVGTIDYAAPEVLAGKQYRGKEQDVWALGILLYTIVYKENPFYSIDEIMDHDLRVPYVVSEHSIDLIRQMLNRDVGSRISIEGVVAHPWVTTAAAEDGDDAAAE